jgi:hypothetical protein
MCTSMLWDNTFGAPTKTMTRAVLASCRATEHSKQHMLVNACVWLMPYTHFQTHLH